ncbi:MAG: hypothetical protein P0116_07005 [Candidatus Nitrosocosmicus sp.]|nr:hypothetical protein [Candidatus Nitrosocosmicus sp.]
MATVVHQIQYSSAYSWENCAEKKQGKAPIAISGDNVYVAWWGNSMGNHEVMFKISGDVGETFGIRLILAIHQMEPRLKPMWRQVATTCMLLLQITLQYSRSIPCTSNDNGETFNPLVRLSNDFNSSSYNEPGNIQYDL